MEWWIYFLAAISTGVLLTAIVWFIIVYYKQEKIPKDMPIVLNFLSNLSNGVFIGTQKSVDANGKKGRLIVEIDPRDVDLQVTPNPTPVKVIVDKDKLVSMPKGSASKDKTVNIILPVHAEDISPQLKDTLIGRAIMWATELENLKKTQTEILREGNARRDELLKKIGDGEISKEFLQFTDELVKDFLESTLLGKQNLNRPQSPMGPGGGFPQHPPNE